MTLLCSCVHGSPGASEHLSWHWPRRPRPGAVTRQSASAVEEKLGSDLLHCLGPLKIALLSRFSIFFPASNEHIQAAAAVVGFRGLLQLVFLAPVFRTF